MYLTEFMVFGAIYGMKLELHSKSTSCILYIQWNQFHKSLFWWEEVPFVFEIFKLQH